MNTFTFGDILRALGANHISLAQAYHLIHTYNP